MRNSLIYYFLEYRLNLHVGYLYHGNNEINIRPKTFNLLCYLIQNSGRIISRDELFCSIWPDTIVTEGSLTRCIAEIRQALNDNGNIVKTVPKRGYIFISPVQVYRLNQQPEDKIDVAQNQDKQPSPPPP